jgi:hypothetical protein
MPDHSQKTEENRSEQGMMEWVQESGEAMLRVSSQLQERTEALAR